MLNPLLPKDVPQTGNRHNAEKVHGSGQAALFSIQASSGDKPPYVDNEAVTFRHDRCNFRLKFLSDWKSVEQSMQSNSEECALYFPAKLNIRYDHELEARLARDMQAWQYFGYLGPQLGRLAINISRFCSVACDISYEQRVLLHRHIAWIFLMDAVSEQLPLYKLHDTAGKMYLENLKSIARGGPVKDMMQFKGCCPDRVLQDALNAQHILAEDLMPLKWKLLTPEHAQKCVDTLSIYFDQQYEEGHKFCTEQTSEEVLKTRPTTVGTMMPMLLSMTPAQAQLYHVNDAFLIQLCIYMALVNDVIGLYKDLDSVEAGNDGSAYLNLVRVGMRQYGYSEEESLRSHISSLNHFARLFEFTLPGYSPERQALYLDRLTVSLAFLDYHLMGILNKPNNRFGWKQTASES